MSKRRYLTAPITGDEVKKEEVVDFSVKIADLHAHPAMKATWFGYDLRDPHRKRGLFRNLISKNPLGFDPLSLRTSFPALRLGQVDVMFSTAYALERQTLDDLALNLAFSIHVPLKTLAPILAPFMTSFLSKKMFTNYFTATTRSIEKVEDQLRDVPGIGIAHALDEFEKIERQGGKALIHALEGAHCLESKTTYDIQIKNRNGDRSEADMRVVEQDVMDNLDELYEMGVAMIGLCHYYPNEVTNSCFSFPDRMLDMIPPERWHNIWRDPRKGLTPLGEKVISRMLDLGIIIDVSHVSPEGRAQIYEIVDTKHDGKPCAIAASHIGLQAMYPHPYNLADWELKWIADNGGVVGLMFSNYWLTGREGVKLGLGHIAHAVEHLYNVGGENVVAFGSDYDGFSDPPDDLPDASKWQRLIAQLYRERDVQGGPRYTQEQIQKFFGENTLRVIRKGWGRKSASDPIPPRDAG